jgi:Transglutaminase-like superfamily
MSLGERLRRLRDGWRETRGLSSADRRLFLRAWHALLVSRLEVRRRREDWTDLVSEGSEALSPPEEHVDHLVAVFERARATCPVATSCLPASLALRRFLKRHGVAARLRLGARKIGSEWSGHAWVERGGRMLGDRPELVRHFVPFHETA